MTGTLSLPVVGNNNSTEDVKVRDTLTALNGLLTASNALDGAQLGASTVAAAALASNAVTTAKILDANVTTAKLAPLNVTTATIADANVTTAKIADANVTDAKLASPNNSVYRTVATLDPHPTQGTATGTFYPHQQNASGARGWLASDSAGAGPGTHIVLGAFDFASGDFTTTLTTRFRIRAQVYVGATSPSTVTFNVGLYPLTVSAGNWHLGTVVTGSQTGTSPTPALATNTVSRITGGDFAASALLSDPGTYAFGVIIGSITAPSGISVGAQLQMRST